MEENVALDSRNQKKFVKSIKGIKKLLKKNDKNEDKSSIEKDVKRVKPQKQFSMRLKRDGKVSKKKRFQRGLVYLSHIPHGFYEDQMTQYFKQFGAVTNTRVIRSKRTGNSKGFAFVEFREPSVAQIVAETMNNYLMGKRLIKAAYIPPEKIRRNAFRKKWNTVHNPTKISRMKFNKEFNANKDEEQNLKKAKKLLSNLNKTKKKLRELGVNYDFFTPVDVPPELLDSVVKKEKDDEINDEESNPKKRKMEKDEKQVVKNKKVKNGTQIIMKEISKDNKIKKANKPPPAIQLNKKEKETMKKEITSKDNVIKKNKNPPQVNKKEQKNKEKQLKAAGVKSVEEFIGLDADDSDDSCEFDSDEYEKILEEDDDDDDTEDSADESEESADESEEEIKEKKQKRRR